MGHPCGATSLQNLSHGPPSLSLLLPCASIYRIVSVKTVTIKRTEMLRDVYINFAVGFGLPVPNSCCAESTTGILNWRGVQLWKRRVLSIHFSHYSKYPLWPLTSLNFSFQSSCQTSETCKMKGHLHRQPTEPCCKFNSIQFGGNIVPLSSKYLAS